MPHITVTYGLLAGCSDGSGVRIGVSYLMTEAPDRLPDDFLVSTRIP